MNKLLIVTCLFIVGCCHSTDLQYDSKFNVAGTKTKPWKPTKPTDVWRTDTPVITYVITGVI